MNRPLAVVLCVLGGCPESTKSASKPSPEVSVPVPVASEPPPPPAAPGAVVVRRVAGAAQGPIISRCLPTERLVGGGCDSDTYDAIMGHPVDFGTTDSLGAGWRCVYPSRSTDNEMRTFALCQGTAGSRGDAGPI